jgi:hypothetical protein
MKAFITENTESQRRRLMKIYHRMFILILAFIIAGTIGVIASRVDAQIVSQGVSHVPVIDGQKDAVWESASEIVVPVIGGANTPSTEVRLKSVYAGDMVYFLAVWKDPTESNRRSPWQKQADGTWQKLNDPNDQGGDNNLYYEDKLSMIWDISITGFSSAGCFTMCHAGEVGKPYGNKYTAGPGQVGDIWHWKGVRTNTVGQVDDQYVDDVRYDADKSPEAGRHSDPKTAGGYSDNVNADKTGPAFTSPTQPGTYWILDSEKQSFADTYNAGDEIAGIIVSPIVGDRGDISGKGTWSNGEWTLEIGRKLVTGSQYDVQFDDMTKTYYFGVATFDNAQVRHSFNSGAISLMFGPPTPTSVAQTTWGVVKSLFMKH